MDWSSVDWNNAANGLLLVLVSILAWMGKRKAEGKSAAPVVVQPTPALPPGGAASPAVEINALVDSRSLTSHTAALEALNLTQLAGQKQSRDLVELQLKHAEEMREHTEELAEKYIEALGEFTKALRGVGYALDHSTKAIEALQLEVRQNTLEVIRQKK